jgi:hypothetical protein
MHIADWSADNPGGTGQRRLPVGKARKFTWRRIYKKKNTRHHFRNDLCTYVFMQSDRYFSPILKKKINLLD